MLSDGEKTLPSLESVLTRVAWIQNQIILTRVACALEVFRLEEGDWVWNG